MLFNDGEKQAIPKWTFLRPTYPIECFYNSGLPKKQNQALAHPLWSDQASES